MVTTAVDPIAELLAAGEGKLEWVRGSLLRVPPPSFDHEILRGFLQTILSTYVAKHRLGEVLGETYFEQLEPDLIRSPDLAFFRTSSLSRITPNYSEGGADLVVEIVSPTSRGRDRFDKRHDYERAGIEEYWVVDPERREAEFYRLRDGAYEAVHPDGEGRLFSSVVPGFFVRVEWLWKRPDLLAAYRELGIF